MSKTIIIPQNSEYIRVFSKPDALEKEKPVTGQRKGKNPLSIRGQDAQEALKGRDPQVGPGTAAQLQPRVYRQQFPGVGGTNNPTFSSLPTKVVMPKKTRGMKVSSRRASKTHAHDPKAMNRVHQANEGLVATSGIKKRRMKR